MKRKTVAVALIACLAVVVGGAAAYGVYRSIKETQYADAACAVVHDELAARGDVVTIGSGSPDAAIIGDSYTIGHGLPDPSEAWPNVLSSTEDETVAVAGVEWTGLVNDGPCHDQRFATRIDAVNEVGAPTLVIAGGLNDARDDLPGVQEATESLIEKATATRIIVVGPVDAPAVKNEARVDEEMRAAADVKGVQYVSALDWNLPFLDDGTHLTAEGHAMYAAKVAAALRA